MPLLQANGIEHDYSAEACKEMLDLSLQRLGVDYIDGECWLQQFAVLAASGKESDGKCCHEQTCFALQHFHSCWASTAAVIPHHLSWELGIDCRDVVAAAQRGLDWWCGSVVQAE